MARIYVGNLPMDVKEREIDDLFYKYGRIRSIDIKVAARPPAFAFISFEDTRDAEDAVRGRDGYEFDGMRLRCEFSKAERRDDRFGGGGGRDFGRGPPQRSEFGVVVTNLPKACSWQDLKDHMRKAGSVLYADIDRSSGDGEVEFAERRDMEYALDKMDDQEFRHKSGETSYIRVKLRSRGGGGGGRSRSRDRSRSPPPRDRSKSPAPAEKDRSRSRTRD